MKKSFLSSKIHKATITDSQLDYEGSCEIDISLLNAAGISVHEKIDIYNITNGERFTTYAIKGKAETGDICYQWSMLPQGINWRQNYHMYLCRHR